MFVSEARIQNQNQLLAKNIELLRAENIRFKVQGKAGYILDIKHLSVFKGSCVFVAGKNGAGKSSLLSFLGGYLAVPSSAVFWKGAQVQPLEERLVPGFEGTIRIGQDPELNPFLTAQEELEKALRGLPENEKKLRRNDVLRLCRLHPLLGQKTGSLSGGEKRRIALARALIREPELVLLDEPFADLDSENKQLFYMAILEAIRSRQTSFVVVSHDGNDAKWLASEVWILESGRIREKMKPISGTFHPKTASAARLLGWNTLLPLAVVRRHHSVAHLGHRWIHIPENALSVRALSGFPVWLGRWTLLHIYSEKNALMGIFIDLDHHLLVAAIDDPVPSTGTDMDLYTDPTRFVFLK